MFYVATVLTVYGIETLTSMSLKIPHLLVATVLTVYGIETMNAISRLIQIFMVATVLTVYGIETGAADAYRPATGLGCNSTYRLRY